MNILFKWERCSNWDNEELIYYFIECPKTGINDKILHIMRPEDRKKCLTIEYIMRNNEWIKSNEGLGTFDCIYFLISEKINRIILEEPIFPYSSLWNSYSPLKKCFYEIEDIEEILDIKEV